MTFCTLIDYLFKRGKCHIYFYKTQYFEMADYYITLKKIFTWHVIFSPTDVQNMLNCQLRYTPIKILEKCIQPKQLHEKKYKSIF